MNLPAQINLGILTLMKNKLLIFFISFIVFFLPQVVFPYVGEKQDQDCQKRKAKVLKKKEILIMVSTPKGEVPLLSIKGNKLKKPPEKPFKSNRNKEVKEPFLEMYSLPNQNPIFIDVVQAYDPKAETCIWFGKAKSNFANWTLFSSKKNINIFTNVTKEMKKDFFSISSTCKQHGDSGDCIPVEIIATSDLNENKILEYWYVDPYMWDIGFAVGELDKKHKKINIISSACLFCD